MTRGGGPLYLALDQGGHASRAFVFDARGAQLAGEWVDVDAAHPEPDWVEQDADALAASVRLAAERVLLALGLRAADVVAVGLATQRSTIVCWDRQSGEALTPAISWQDRRAHRWLEQFSGHAEKIRALTGLRLSPHYGASKLRWCLDHVPAVIAARDNGRLAMGPLASFLAFRLLAERPHVADPANAARTLLWNLSTLDWDQELLALFGVPRELLPRCVPSAHAYGNFSVGTRNIPCRLVTGDQSAALFAQGEPAFDAAYVNIGTGAFVLRIAERGDTGDGPLLSSVVYRDAERTYFVSEGTVNGAGSAIAWAAKELGIENIERELDGWMGRAADPPLFLNGVGGLGSPYWRPDFVSRFVGEGDARSRAVAVAESILFLLRANLDEMSGGDRPLTQLVVSGGLAAVDALCQGLADLSCLPVYRPAETEATARGTAFLLAGRPADWWQAGAGKCFESGVNESLRLRYQRWRAAMRVQ